MKFKLNLILKLFILILIIFSYSFTSTARKIKSSNKLNKLNKLNNKTKVDSAKLLKLIRDHAEDCFGTACWNTVFFIMDALFDPKNIHTVTNFPKNKVKNIDRINLALKYLNEDKVVYIMLNPDHHFIIIKDGDYIDIYQSFGNNAYHLSTWIDYYFGPVGHPKQKMKISVFFDNLKKVIDRKSTKSDFEEGIKNIFYLNDKITLNKCIEHFTMFQKHIDIISISYASESDYMNKFYFDMENYNTYTNGGGLNKVSGKSINYITELSRYGDPGRFKRFKKHFR